MGYKPKDSGNPKGNKTKAERLSKGQITLLVAECVELISDCKATRTIIKHFESKGLQSGQIRNILESAANIIVEENKQDAKEILARAKTRLERMIEDCKKNGNYKVALEAQRELDKISGLHTGRLEISAEITIPTVIESVEYIRPTNEDQDNTSLSI